MTVTTYDFNYTGSDQMWTVPFYTSGTMTFRLQGGGGGQYRSNSGGGAGGWIRGAMSPAPGTVLTIRLGDKGANGISGVFYLPSAPGGGGPRPGGDGVIYGSHAMLPAPGGVSYDVAGGGGGGSELWVGATLVAVAGGGSGGPAIWGSAGWHVAASGAGQTGSGGQISPTSNSPSPSGDGYNAYGGTTSAAGLGGGSSSYKYPTYLTAGFDGSGGSGGDGASRIYVPGSGLYGSNCGGGGGGGGTYFDGGMCGVAVFNKALSTADHEAIAAAAGL